MSDGLDEFREVVTKPGPKCTLGQLLRDLPEDQAAKLTAALEAEDIGPVQIRTVLERWGYRTNRTTIARHRRRECQCPT